MKSVLAQTLFMIGLYAGTTPLLQAQTATPGATATAPAVTTAGAAASTSRSVASGVRYEMIGRWDVDKLNTILKKDTPAFSGVQVSYTPARNAVILYRVTYPSVIPERGNQPILASGLLAIPDTPARAYPMVSYQHGTVYERKQVPSFPEQSPETQLMIAQFAGQGYVLIGADYFGMGISTEPEGYMVKGSHQQATYDMLMAARSVLAGMGVHDDKLFLSGWSQGGFVTMAFLEKLEAAGVKVDGATTASAPLDVFALLEGFLTYPRPNDAAWLNSIVILSAFAFENYYGVPGLARSVLADKSYEVARKAYEREPFQVSEIPTDLHQLMRPEYFDPQYFARSAYGRLIATTQAYRWVIRSDVRNYYGESDEAITPGVGRMAMTYAQAMGAGNPHVQAISTGPTTHRGTFATAVPAWKQWFDGK
ncbi:MAG TPA: alpha/beta hydrolase [Herbaspirillum sp.]|uniref:alpha/beta hydrolase family protein n=1 Tax=Herbaspirillum sp. TaxID=1890675 RepID=UPI002D262A71|nr:alpha/beta hydrolase [Herbaspirillum sp.]HZG20060.1 alpha/beta hydrolase [Herbaspirillum sp.]